MAATMAAQTGSASRSDVQDCDRAITHGNLSRRDLLATHVNRGVLHAAVGDNERAAADYDRAVALGPASGEVYVNRGNLQFARSDYAAAAREYDQALQLGLSREYVAHYNRGLAFEKLHDYGRAEADYRRALELAPDWLQPKAKLERLAREARR